MMLRLVVLVGILSTTLGQGLFSGFPKDNSANSTDPDTDSPGDTTDEPADDSLFCPTYTEVGTVLVQAEDYCEMEGILIGENYYAGWIDPDDWMAYGVEVKNGRTFDIHFRYASEKGEGGFEVELYDETVHTDWFGATIQRVESLPSTGAWNNWQTLTLEAVSLPAGKHVLIIRATAPGWNLDWMDFTVTSDDNSNGDGDGTDVPDASSCEYISAETQIQAEAFCDMNGIEVGEDDSSSQYVGWIDAGDWILYGTRVNEEGLYDISYRFASTTSDGGFKVEVFDSDTFNVPVLTFTVDSLPNTGDWYSWQTASQEVTLPVGDYFIIIRATAPGWNLDWFRVSLQGDDTPTDNNSGNHNTGDGTDGGCIVIVDTGNTNSGSAPVSVQGNGFVRAEGTSIVDGQGENLILRGVGFGGWMLQEPYMMKFDESTGQRDLFARIEALTGTANLETYRQAWLDNYLTKGDIQELKDSGFNSLRVPLHYELFTPPLENEPVQGQINWIDEGFQRLDLLLDWCKEVDIYLILDLHAAPGGQGRNSQINDYDVNYPSLWENDDNVKKAIALWVKFAERYKDEQIVAGYDLINEPNWNFVPGHPNGCSEQENSLLDDFYDRAIPAIREIDTNHIIYIEGNCWGNNHNGLWPIDDDNIVLSFHKYWNPNTVSEIQKFLDWQKQYNVPLWMGEAGENDNNWYQEAVDLLESYNIGWAWWTWKKLKNGRGDGPFTIETPDDYQTLLNYWRNGGQQPSAEFTLNAMLQVAENAKLENCIRNDATIDALTGQRKTCDDTAPVVLDSADTTRIEAEDACKIVGFQTEACEEGGLNVGYTDQNDTLEFVLNVPTAGLYVIEYRVATEAGAGNFQLLVGSEVVGGVCTLPNTGGWQVWETVSHRIDLMAGPQRITVMALSAGWNLNWLQLKLA